MPVTLTFTFTFTFTFTANKRPHNLELKLWLNLWLMFPCLFVGVILVGFCKAKSVSWFALWWPFPALFSQMLVTLLQCLDFCIDWTSPDFHNFSYNSLRFCTCEPTPELPWITELVYVVPWDTKELSVGGLFSNNLFDYNYCSLLIWTRMN